MDLVQSLPSYKSPLGDCLELRGLGLDIVDNLGVTLDFY